MLVGQSTVLMLPPAMASAYSVAGGVPGYSAPEQARGTATARSDLYAVCAILQHAVTGSTPPPRANWMHPPARRQNPNVSLELEEVLGKGLRPSATQRFASAEELRAALEPLAAGRRTLVPEELRDASAGRSLAPVRNARGRLVLPRRRANQPPFVLVAVLLCILVGLGAGAFYVTSQHSGSSGATTFPTPNEVASDYQNRGIGISSGDLIFDTQLPDGAQKQTGARDVSANDLQGAYTAYSGAHSTYPQDAEAAIYAENLSILIAQQPYVTLIAGVAFGADTDTARSELQGVYLIQHRVNQFDLLPNGVKVRVLIVNSGAKLADVTVVSTFLLNFVQHGNSQHFVGVIGWPTADETQLALTVLKPTSLTVVSPTASSDNVAGLGATFFPIVPADSVQGGELADAAVNQLGAQRVMVLTDSKSAISSHTSQGFLQEIRPKLAGGFEPISMPYTSGDTVGFSAIAATAEAQRIDLIFVACGDNCDTSTAHLAGSLNAQVWPGGTPPKILMDSHGYSPALVGLGTSSAAQYVRNNPSIFRSQNVYVTSLADANVWNDQKDLGADIIYDQPNLPGDYTAQFEPENSAAEPNATTSLSYDAAHIVMIASSTILQVQGGTIAPINTAQVSANLLQFTSAHPFMGVTGAIGYGPTGWMTSKALVIEQLVPAAGGTVVNNNPIAQPQFAYLVGGKDLFCGKAPNCKPS